MNKERDIKKQEARAHENMAQAAKLAGNLPGILLQAEKIAHTVMRGAHGRRRVGQGEAFWQFREYQPGDSSRDIDWRQTAKREETFVRQQEWEASQSAWLYRDSSESMQYRSSARLPFKKDYAEILLLALAMLVLDGGEQVGLLGTPLAPQAHAGAAQRLHDYLSGQKEFDAPGRRVAARSHLVMMSDFYFPLERLHRFCAPLAAQEVRGIFLQVTDPAEESLPFSGRMKFHDIENMKSAPVTVEQVDAVRAEYQARFSAHRAALSDMARNYGWQFLFTSTAEPAEKALARMYDLVTAKR